MNENENENENVKKIELLNLTEHLRELTGTKIRVSVKIPSTGMASDDLQEDIVGEVTSVHEDGPSLVISKEPGGPARRVRFDEIELMDEA